MNCTIIYNTIKTLPYIYHLHFNNGLYFYLLLAPIQLILD